MSETGSRWQTADTDEALARRLAEELQIPVPLAIVLASRGYTDRQQIDRFLNPRLSELSDPYALPQMGAAVTRVWKAVDDREPIVVYGDYDADGVVSTALLVSVLRQIGAEVSSYLPSRDHDGYGFTLAGLEKCIQPVSPGLIITVDCGTNSVEAVDAARELGIDVVVTDHHEPAVSVAEPVALVNPKNGDDPSATGLAGVGVAFKLCHAIIKRGRDDAIANASSIDLRQYLHWVALGTVADIAPLIGENRALVRHGLSRFPDAPEPGIRALMRMARVDSEVNAWHIAFGIAPRINAAGRLGDANLALDLLLETDEARAETMAAKLDAINTERQSIEKGMTKWATKHAGQSFDPDSSFSVIVARDNWHVGIVGIVASRLCKKFGRPAVVIAFGDDGIGTGSCRSIPELNLAEALEACDEHLLAHGGHALAAGLSVEKQKFEEFCEAFASVCEEKLSGRDIRPVQQIDAWLDLRDADERLWEAVGRMEPFGEGNRAPVWGARGVTVAGEPRVLKKEHLKMTVVSGTTQKDAIGFGLGGMEVPDGPIDIAFVLDMNRFRGNEMLQLKLKSFRASISE